VLKGPHVHEWARPSAGIKHVWIVNEPGQSKEVDSNERQLRHIPSGVNTSGGFRKRETRAEFRLGVDISLAWITSSHVRVKNVGGAEAIKNRSGAVAVGDGVDD